jgi:hypothetical protein
MEYNIYIIYNNLPYFSDNIENLKFIAEDLFGKINRYIRKYKLSIYLFQYRDTILIASRNAGGADFYFVGENIFFIFNLFTVMDSSLLLNDLNIINWVYAYYIEFTQDDRIGLKLSVLFIFTVDNL